MPVQGANCPDPLVWTRPKTSGRRRPGAPRMAPSRDDHAAESRTRHGRRGAHRHPPGRCPPARAGDSERFSHYVPKNKLMEALVNGTPVRALCGKVWTPSRDPKKYPVCPECKEIWDNLPPGEDRDPDR